MHAPGTALMDDFLTKVESAASTLEALGLTDYYSVECYKAVVREKEAGQLSNIRLLFPNIELRLSVGTKAGSGVNAHLLISPEDSDHVERIEGFWPS